jgi:spoIIIJ-associated protein
MHSVEADGNSIDEAIASALTMLGTTRDRVEIEIVSNAARGLFGIGSRKARVRATLRTPIDADEPLERGASAGTALPQKELSAGSTATRAAEVLQRIIEHLGVDAAVAIQETSDHFLLELTGDSSGVLIGRRGQMLDALEYIVNRIVLRDSGATRIVIDSQNYRARRRDALEDLARRMAEQAKNKGRSVTLNPMSPRDRRIVHLILQGDPTLSTKSSGKGYFRRLIIVPMASSRGTRTDLQDE